MTPSRKKPGVAFWATVVVVAVLVAYPLSFGLNTSVRRCTDRREGSAVAAVTAGEADLCGGNTIGPGKFVIEDIGQFLSKCGYRVLFWWKSYLATRPLSRPVPTGWERMWLLDLPPEMERRISGARI